MAANPSRKPTTQTAGVAGTAVSYSVEGTLVHGIFYRPADSADEALPTIVMAHGWAMTTGGNLEEYATVLASRGFAVLTFDFRNLGRSDGMPRQELDPWRQIEDFRTAITYVQSRNDVDSGRIGLWGTSYSGGHALVVAAIDRRVRCVVSQVPTISGFENARRRMSPEREVQLQERFAADRKARFAGHPPATIPLVDQDPKAPVAYPGHDSYRYMFGESSRCPQWVNEVTLRSLELARTYEPGAFVRRISPTPMLLVIADADVLTPTDLQRDAFASAGEPKRLVEVEGGHYSPYVTHFAVSSEAAASWFSEHL